MEFSLMIRNRRQLMQEQSEHVINSLKRDFRNLERAVRAETSDSYVLALLTKMQHTIFNTQAHIRELSKKA